MTRPQTLLVKRIGACLYPVDEAAAERIRRLPMKEATPIRIWRERSAHQNSLYWQVLDRVVETTGKWHSAEELHLALKVACGYVDRVRLLNGRLVLTPGSISFDKLDQEGAQRFYDAALRIVSDEIMGGMSLEEILERDRAA